MTARQRKNQTARQWAINALSDRQRDMVLRAYILFRALDSRTFRNALWALWATVGGACLFFYLLITGQIDWLVYVGMITLGTGWTAAAWGATALGILAPELDDAAPPAIAAPKLTPRQLQARYNVGVFLRGLTINRILSENDWFAQTLARADYRRLIHSCETLHIVQPPAAQGASRVLLISDFDEALKLFADAYGDPEWFAPVWRELHTRSQPNTLLPFDKRPV